MCRTRTSLIKRSQLVVNQYNATDGGSISLNVASDSATAIGSQAANGPDSSVVGIQTVQGDSNNVAGRDATMTSVKDQPVKEGWWTRWRKRGVLVALCTIVSAVIAVFTWIGWTPWD